MGDFADKPHNLLYVHGFNVGFDAAVLQAAYFGVDLKVPGATFLFSWPSAGSVREYMADEASIEASLRPLEEFVATILKNTAEIPLSIIVHSMGSRVIIRYLDLIAREQATFARGRIRNVMLAAPDVDVDEFKHSATRFAFVAQRTTMYATRADLALATSAWLHGYHRAGLAPPVTAVAGMDTIVVEGFNLLDLGHSYYAEASSVLHDMFNLFHYGSEPIKRPGVISAETAAGQKFWRLSVR